MALRPFQGCLSLVVDGHLTPLLKLLLPLLDEGFIVTESLFRMSGSIFHLSKGGASLDGNAFDGAMLAQHSRVERCRPLRGSRKLTDPGRKQNQFGFDLFKPVGVRKQSTDC